MIISAQVCTLLLVVSVLFWKVHFRSMNWSDSLGDDRNLGAHRSRGGNNHDQWESYVGWAPNDWQTNGWHANSRGAQNDWLGWQSGAWHGEPAVAESNMDTGHVSLTSVPLPLQVQGPDTNPDSPFQEEPLSAGDWFAGSEARPEAPEGLEWVPLWDGYRLEPKSAHSLSIAFNPSSQRVQRLTAVASYTDHYGYDQVPNMAAVAAIAQGAAQEAVTGPIQAAYRAQHDLAVLVPGTGDPNLFDLQYFVNTLQKGANKQHNVALKWFRQDAEAKGLDVVEFSNIEASLMPEIVHAKGTEFEFRGEPRIEWRWQDMVAQLRNEDLQRVVQGNFEEDMHRVVGVTRPMPRSRGLVGCRLQKTDKYDHKRHAAARKAGTAGPNDPMMYIWDFVLVCDNGTLIFLHPSYSNNKIECYTGYEGIQPARDHELPGTGRGGTSGPGTFKYFKNKGVQYTLKFGPRAPGLGAVHGDWAFLA